MFIKQKPLQKKLLIIAIVSISPSISFSKIIASNPLKKSWECTSSPNGKWQCYETGDQTYKLFINGEKTTEKDNIIARALGWIPTDNKNSVCKGYYYQGYFFSSKDPDNTYVQFNQAQYPASGDILAEGGVEVQKGGQYLSANKATILANTETKKPETIKARGNVNLRQPGQLIISANAQTNLSSDKSKLNDTYYLLKVVENPKLKSDAEKQYNNFTGFARGHANTITQKDKNHFTLKKATYTTGSPYDHDWLLSATTIDLDKISGRGQAYNDIFWIQGVPVFYWPYMSFPIDNRRQSGFLYPLFGTSGNSGAYFSTPYYFNLAPNFDFLLTPTYYTTRGLMLDGNTRYLTEQHEGNVDLSYMANDRKYGNSRTYLGFNDIGKYSPNLTSSLTYNYVSDHEFLKDFNSDNMQSTNQTLLDRQASLNYADQNLTINGTFLDYGVLDDTLELANRPYATLPQINFNANYPNKIKYITFGINNQFTYFYKNPLSNTYQVGAQRLYTAPFISLPLQRSWGFFTPTLTATETLYTLQHAEGNSVQSQYPNRYLSRNLPIFNIDSGLYFERNFNLNDTSYNQVLEPRLFYTYIPYKDQNNIPLFDTSFTNFSYASLFQTNRFTGYDRINNANQISYALQTTINNSDNGQQIISAGIGQTAYFQDRKVSLCRTSGCIATENPDYKDTVSDIAAFTRYQFLPNWYFQTDLTYKAKSTRFDTQSYALQYQPDPQHILSIAYQDYRNNYALLTPTQITNGEAAPSQSQVTLSGLWKLTPSWSVVSMWSYSFTNTRTVNMFAGFEYDACSWAFRFLAQRYVNINTDINNNNPATISGPLTNAFIFQVVLKGLGGTSPGGIQDRLSMVPGYNPTSSGF